MQKTREVNNEPLSWLCRNHQYEARKPLRLAGYFLVSYLRRADNVEEAMSMHYWPDKSDEPYEYTGGRCLCDDCCRHQPERLKEREELARSTFRRWVPPPSYDPKRPR